MAIKQNVILLISGTLNDEMEVPDAIKQPNINFVVTQL